MKTSIFANKSAYYLLYLLLLLTSCGYKFQPGLIPSSYSTISVPFVKGDEDGSFTSTLIREIEQNGRLNYVDHCGDLELFIKLIDLREENIGFRYDRNRRNKIINSIIPTETRIFIVAEVTLIEKYQCKSILGPIEVITSVEFDHDYYSSRNGINIFSLGQLTDLDEAREAVKTPLYKALARKIVEYINESW